MSSSNCESEQELLIRAQYTYTCEESPREVSDGMWYKHLAVEGFVSF